MQRIIDNHSGGVSPYAELNSSRGKEKMGKCERQKRFFSRMRAAMWPSWWSWILSGVYCEHSCPYTLGTLRWGSGKTSQHHLHEAGEEREANSRSMECLVFRWAHSLMWKLTYYYINIWMLFERLLGGLWEWFEGGFWSWPCATANKMKLSLSSR